ncbi:diphosphomevalonate decarboxylase [Chishuiella changwenlii]|uniref:Diphosphomevalonate decarboxylase n=1 Tax=Chishuiella changwenlii TaxID=1434701 RepID=A0A1M6ZDN7_9FLAO|nr:diphosphomevalonate decarboxylase [Chishuiella changwenlii]GGE86325.1 diphosphomevalonate decarboxylase [Chishuiella changwenlii]SHL28611.1 diphosphomevalonate decarboxylase [Chishuiella changwenlii]
MEQQFISKLSTNAFSLEKGSVNAKSPSNIALIKYWGKKKNQIPTNSSISYTLTNSYTETELKFSPKTSEEFDVEVYLEGELKESFTPKIITFFERITAYIPFLKHYKFEVHTHNSFPHSSGIASSASGMSAMALCLVQIENILGANLTEDELLQKASFLARLGSGSACRSVYKGLVEWGENNFIEGSSDLYGTKFPDNEIHEVFKTFHDTILLIHEGQKSVSSTVGHNLMNGHPYAEQRFIEANDNLKTLIPILKNGDVKAFGELVEHEALTLHAMMMMSNPAFILMKPNTVAALEKLWEFRRETGKQLYFTLDAGANVHLLYPAIDAEAIEVFIENELKKFCQNGNYIEDKVTF